jgi:cation:H+ antiporter
LLVFEAVKLSGRWKISKILEDATIVGLGTTIPETVVSVLAAITDVRKNHGEPAVGNVIGADILNVLFVAGTAASVSQQGLMASTIFSRSFFRQFSWSFLSLGRVCIFTVPHSEYRMA